MESRILRVGAAEIDFLEAMRLTSDYLKVPDNISDARSAYPAYDGYPGGPTCDVSEQDLLAFILLNVNNKPIPSYYSLLGALPQINARLNSPHITGTLVEANNETLDALADLIGILDGPNMPHIRLTKLSKVLHRKRPHLIPLYDDHIRRCYMEKAPIRIMPQRDRSWRDFALIWLSEVQRDLTDQLPLWEELASLAKEPPISPLRALDIVGWHLGNPNAL